jgi:hypothetical protein
MLETHPINHRLKIDVSVTGEPASEVTISSCESLPREFLDSLYDLLVTHFKCVKGVTFYKGVEGGSVIDHHEGILPEEEIPSNPAEEQHRQPVGGTGIAGYCQTSLFDGGGGGTLSEAPVGPANQLERLEDAVRDWKEHYARGFHSVDGCASVSCWRLAGIVQGFLL